jgi:putative tryptophan/tyrosine transport system substrate-binding protein
VLNPSPLLHFRSAGADPNDLPIENIGRLEFVVNHRTAKELGISVPRSIVSRADQVIK